MPIPEPCAPPEVDEALELSILQAEIAQRHILANDKIGLLYAIRRLTAYARFLEGWAKDQQKQKQAAQQPKKDDFDALFG
jgi:hypothetical protein